VGLDQFPNLHDVVEDGKTFQENALKKAREMVYCQQEFLRLLMTVGYVLMRSEVIQELYSARWAGAHGDDAANTEKSLAQLIDVPG
jgi:XTP/dITP diphosphohydrolase